MGFAPLGQPWDLGQIIGSAPGQPWDSAMGPGSHSTMALVHLNPAIHPKHTQEKDPGGTGCSMKTLSDLGAPQPI